MNSDLEKDRDRKAITYLTNNRYRVCCPEVRSQEYQIQGGTIDRLQPLSIDARLKRAGRHHPEEVEQAIKARAVCLSGEWDQLRDACQPPRRTYSRCPARQLVGAYHRVESLDSVYSILYAVHR